jgi:curved DNA-binding protein CbpA
LSLVRRLPTTNHYERLGVRPDVTPDELRRAYRRLALDAHPDRRDDGAPDAMAAINEAWNVLGDPQRRAEYDRALAPPRSEPAPAPPAHARAVATEPEDLEADDPDPNWVDLTPQMRRFRRLLTMTLVLGAIFLLLVFWLIIWPETA